MTVEAWTGSQSLAHWAKRAPHAIAATESGQRYTYGDMAGLVVRMAKHLSVSGLSPGSIVGIECSSRYIELVMILACECLGLITTSFVASELTSDNDLLSRCAVIYTEEPCPSSRAVPLTLDLIVSVARIPITADDFRTLDFQPAPDSGGRIVKTSGTTGKQKCMRNSSVGVSRGVTVTRYMLDLLEGSQNFLNVYPLGFRPSYTGSVLALQSGRTVVFGDINQFFGDLAAIGACQTVLLPTDAALACAAYPGSRGAVPRCCVQINGGSLSAPLRRELLATFATSVYNTYSINETNFIALIDEDGVGTLLPGAEVRIVADNGSDRPLGETGVIVIRSPRMVSGYLWDDALTARYFVDGWHVTGDLGFQPAADRLVVLGRADDVLNIGGVKVPPQPIEAAIRAIDGIRDAVLLGIPHAQGIDRLHVVVERSDSGRDAELERSIRPLIHRYGRGFVAHFQDGLPRTQTGKVRRGALKATIEAQGDEHQAD
jgi:acyl-coenzyme A synthetase/AMP-(fatty) acid ligase